MKSAELQFLFTLRYQARFSDEFSEHEIDHVFIGLWDGLLRTNTDEVNDAKWIAWEEVKKDAQKKPQDYTPWFLKVMMNSQIATVLSK